MNAAPARSAVPASRPAAVRAGALALALAATLCSPAAQARTCYIVYDVKDTIVYRAWVPPFDGVLDYSSAGREALRARGEHFVYFEADTCAPVSGANLPGSGRAATTDEIVAEFPAYSRPSTGVAGTAGRGGGSSAGAASGAGPATRIVAPAAAAMQSRATAYR